MRIARADSEHISYHIIYYSSFAYVCCVYFKVLYKDGAAPYVATVQSSVREGRRDSPAVRNVKQHPSLSPARVGRGPFSRILVEIRRWLLYFSVYKF